jgi:hypothetical protein
LRRTDAGPLDQGIEQYLSEQETKIAPALAKVDEGTQSLTAEERMSIAMMVAVWLPRLPEYFEWAEIQRSPTAHATAKRLHQRFREHPEAFQVFKDLYRQVTGRTSLDDLTIDQTDPDGGHFALPPDGDVSSAQAHAEVHAKILNDMTWAICRSEETDRFITSDCPVYLFNTADGTRPNAGGLLLPYVELSFPLTSRLVLIAKQGRMKLKEFAAPKKTVEMVNWRTGHSASQILVAPGVHFPGVDRVVATFEQNTESER